MRRRLAGGWLGVCLAAAGAAAQDTPPRAALGDPILINTLQPKEVPPPRPVPPPKAPEALPPPPPAIPFARALEAGGLAARSYNENFDGDNVGVFYRRTIVSGFTTNPRVVGFTQQVVGTSQQVTGTTTTTVIDPTNSTRTITTITPVIATVPVIANVPILAQDVIAQRTVLQLTLAGRYSGVQITDNDSPRPTDRVYFGYNFYSNAGGSLNPGIGGSDVQRQTAGFEKTFLDGDASLGMRLPYIQQYGPLAIGSQDVGDLTMIIKYAFYNDRDTGDLVSAGLALTAPTGSTSGVVLADGSDIPHSVLFQPWAGFVRTFDRAYVMGISNLIVPTDGRDLTLWGNSLGAGYRLYQDDGGAILTGITPVAELHVRTPLSNRNADGIIYMQDQLNANAGVHFRFNRAVLSGAVSVPIVGPRPWDIEAIGSFNLLF